MPPIRRLMLYAIDAATRCFRHFCLPADDDADFAPLMPLTLIRFAIAASPPGCRLRDAPDIFFAALMLLPLFFFAAAAYAFHVIFVIYCYAFAPLLLRQLTLPMRATC